MFPPRRFLPPMSLLCAFEAAARHQSFTAAAAELHLTQSAVSRQIRALEDRLGAELFVRERQTVRLSPAGQAYAEDIRGALMRISSATVGFRANPQGGSLNLAILPTFGTRWLAPRLPQFFDQHPGITINLTTRLSQFDFQWEAVDAAIHFGPQHWPGAELALLMSETVVPACSPALLARYNFAQPRDLLGAPLLHLASRPDAWSRWLATHQVDGGDTQGMVFDQFATAALSDRSRIAAGRSCAGLAPCAGDGKRRALLSGLAHRSDRLSAAAGVANMARASGTGLHAGTGCRVICNSGKHCMTCR